MSVVKAFLGVLFLMFLISFALLIPAIGLLAALFVGPVIYSFYLGFTNDELLGPTSKHFSRR